MATINEAKRLIKRVILANLAHDNDNLFITPMISGRHGIGKSEIVRQVAKDIGGVCLTIEGGTLKEGEITGLPYQYQDSTGDICFKFLPYYVIREIKKKEFNIYKNRLGKDIVFNSEDNYSLNDLTRKEKLQLIKSKTVKPIILFIDELNRTDNAVYRELMNIILTKTINGYKLPWWVFFVAAINPSSIDSIYATNEMDPAQLDRFIKIKVQENVVDWVNFAIDKKMDKTIIDFIASNEIYLTKNDEELNDVEEASPSPRGWEMVNIIMQANPYIKDFFTPEELSHIEDDMREIMISKAGVIATSAYYASLKENVKLITASDIYNYQDEISKGTLELLREQSTARNAITNKNILEYLINNYDKDKKKYQDEIRKRTKMYLDAIDKSSRLIFVQSLTNNKTIKNTSLFDEFYSIFDKKVIEMLYEVMDLESAITNE